MPFGSTERERRHDAKTSEAEPEFVRLLRENGRLLSGNGRKPRGNRLMLGPQRGDAPGISRALPPRRSTLPRRRRVPFAIRRGA